MIQHTTKANKLQVTMIDSAHPNGIVRTFSNLVENVADSQVQDFLDLLLTLVPGTIKDVTIATATTLTKSPTA